MENGLIMDNTDEGEHQIPLAFEPRNLDIGMVEGLISEDSESPRSENIPEEELWPNMHCLDGGSGMFVALRIIDHYLLRPMDVLGLLKNYTGNNRTIRFVILNVLEHYYTFEDSALKQDLLKVYRDALVFLKEDVNEVFAFYDWIKSQTKAGILVNVSSQEEAVEYYTRKMNALQSKTSGMTIDMLYL